MFLIFLIPLVMYLVEPKMSNTCRTYDMASWICNFIFNCKHLTVQMVPFLNQPDAI